MSENSTFTIAADGARVIALEGGMVGTGGPIKVLRLRPPTYREFMDLGDPTTLIFASGAVVPQDDLSTIKAYAERLCDADPLLLVQLSLRDAMAIRDAVKSFFSAGSPST